VRGFQIADCMLPGLLRTVYFKQLSLIGLLCLMHYGVSVGLNRFEPSVGFNLEGAHMPLVFLNLN